MKLRFLGVAIVLGLGYASGACGGDDQPYLANDAGVDGPSSPQTFTAFVIDLVNNHTDQSASVPYGTFKDLPDPDGSNSNAYTSLFH